MFDFIKRMFHGKTLHSARPQYVAGLDVVEGSGIEILKTSDYSEGAPAEAIEQLVADQELPPAELDLPMVEAHLPAAQLGEPSDQTEVPLEGAPIDSYTRWLLSVAEEGTASPDILWLLVDDPNPDVRFCLAETYDIDADILKILSEDENPYVAHRANKTMMRLQSPAGKVVDQDFGSGEINRLRKSG